MMTLLEEIRQALRQVWRSPELLERVVPVLVMGIALNVAAFKVVSSMQMGLRMQRKHMATEQCSERMSFEDRVSGAVKKIGNRYGWCVVREWVSEQRSRIADSERAPLCPLVATRRC